MRLSGSNIILASPAAQSFPSFGATQCWTLGEDRHTPRRGPARIFGVGKSCPGWFL